jgi:hypothetical protein
LPPANPVPALVKDLALLLEIDLMLGRKQEFRRRLRNALKDAYQRGIQRKTID